MHETSNQAGLRASPGSTLARTLARSGMCIVALLLIAYAVACVLLYVEQRHLLYFPQNTRVAVRDTNFASRNDGVVLRGWIQNPGQPRALLYFGGNAEAVGDERDAIAAMFPHRTVYLLAYRGYGASDGDPTEQALFSDALALFDRVHQEHVSIAVVGRSLGSGVASWLASRRPVERLALVTPFDSIANVAHAHYPYFPVRWLLQDRYESSSYIGHYRGAVMVLRAGRDDVVPPADTDRLLAAIRASHAVVAFPSAGHNSISDDPGYAAALSGFMK
jgi:pimeloyl-ACP methyl ester carboxylesterase